MIEHEQRNRVALRVLKFLEHPNPGDAVVQKEGELLKRYHPLQKIETVWMARGTPSFITPSSLKLLEQTYLSDSP